MNMQKDTESVILWCSSKDRRISWEKGEPRFSAQRFPHMWAVRTWNSTQTRSFSRHKCMQHKMKTKQKQEGGWSALSKEHRLKKTVNDIHLSPRSNMCSDDDTYAEHVHTHCQEVKHILQWLCNTCRDQGKQHAEGHVHTQHARPMNTHTHTHTHTTRAHLQEQASFSRRKM